MLEEISDEHENSVVSKDEALKSYIKARINSITSDFNRDLPNGSDKRLAIQRLEEARMLALRSVDSGE